MKTQVMLDLETLGQKPGSVIVAIGAVQFGGGKITSEFYRRITATSAVRVGLRIDAETVLWWLKQSDAARAEITQPGEAIARVLMDFTTWLGAAEAEVWGNGAGFDNVLLAAAYDACGLKPPWNFWNDRCYRTMKNLRLVDLPPQTGTAHNALDDARYQAQHLMKILDTP